MWIRDLLQDLRFGIRVLKANRIFTGIVVLTLALGIGVNTAIFSAMNALVLRYAQQLVHLRWEGQPAGVHYSGGDGVPFSEYIFERLRGERQVFSDLMAYVAVDWNATVVRYGREPEPVAAYMVSGNFFSGLGAATICGKAFTMEDEAKHAQVAVLSYAYWSRSFGRDCGVIGQKLYVKGVPFAIIGITAEGFRGIGQGMDVWIPLQNRPELPALGDTGDQTLYGSPNCWCLSIMGRLVPGIGERQALAKLNPIFQRAAYDHVVSEPRRTRLYFQPARGIPGLREAYQEPLSALLAMVGLILAIACGNVAMLLTARNEARQREFSIRMALGGSRIRLFRQLLVESSLLVAAGAGLGWLFAMAATDVMRVWSGLEVSLAPDHTVLLFTMAASILATIIFGLVPLYNSVRGPHAITLRTSTAIAQQHRGKVRGGQLVMALQVSFCLVLMVASGLLARTLRNLEHVDLGLRSSGLLVFGINPPQRLASDAAAIRFHQALLERLRSLPGIESATLSDLRLGAGERHDTAALVDGKRLSDPASLVRWSVVDPSYVHVLGMRIVQGRDFTDADSAAAAKAAIVNETFVKRFLPGANALGHYVGFSFSSTFKLGPFAIVGVMANSKYTGLREDDAPVAYFPFTQVPGVSSVTFELRTAGEPINVLPAVKRAIREYSPDLVPLRPTTQEHEFESSITQERLIARLSLFFGFLAVVLVATGLYGTLAYKISRRTAEFGLRFALGATRHEVLTMVIRRSLVASVAGVAIGIPAAIATGRLLRSFLYGLAPEDPVTYLTAFVGVVLVCVVASWLPARKAASVDPVVALRYE